MQSIISEQRAKRWYMGRKAGILSFCEALGSITWGQERILEPWTIFNLMTLFDCFSRSYSIGLAMEQHRTWYLSIVFLPTADLNQFPKASHSQKLVK